MKPSFITSALLLIAGLTLLGCGQPEIRKVTPTTRVMAFGDSLTAGFGVSHDKNYPTILTTLLGTEVINEGISGEDTDQGLLRLPYALENHRPEIVVLCMGGNDMLRKQSEAKTAANLSEMIELTRASGADIVLIGVPKPGLLLRVPKFYQALADEYDLPFDADLLPHILSKNALKSDHIHPNEAGYQLMAEQIYKLIQDSAR